MKTKNNKMSVFKKKATPWLILLLPMAFTVWLKYYPIASAFYISLFKYDPINPPGRFVGLANYIGMFKMKHYWEAWGNTFVFLFLQIALCFFIPLIQALLLNELIRFKKSLTTLYILPALIPTSVNVIIWKWIWHPDYGVANQIVKFFGGSPQVWLSDPKLVKFCIIFPGIIGGGLTVLLYLSAIQGVSQDMMESAAIDGCTGFSKIWHIILPNISFMIFIQLIMTVITTMQLLDAPYMYTGGGPSGASTTQGIFIYNAFNKDMNYGRGSAASVVLLFIIVILTMVQMWFERSEEG
ncbi:MAG: sugar ABC transporter permease [Epulopiscium sp.]|nr:sugar ABC transporter permease [Candidatus Epulonipiscium sp.]